MDANRTDPIQPVTDGDEFSAAEGNGDAVEPQDGGTETPTQRELRERRQAAADAGEHPAELTDAELLERAGDTSGLKDLGAGDDSREPRAGVAAVAAARDGSRMSDGERVSALDWFLNEDPNAMTETKTKELNFGTEDEPRWIPWVIKAVPMETMRAIRKKAQNTRAARTTGETDEYRVNLEIVLEGTVDPDIKAATAQLNREGRFASDPIDALRAKFDPKPGYIAQLAGAIMTLSGFNDEDVRDAERAAKN